jgi:para-aminobenzoate synthetase component 1
MQDNHILFRNDFTGENVFFSGALSVLTAWTPEEVEPVFRALQLARSQGKWSAGYIAYETGYVLEPALANRLAARPAGDRRSPLMSFGIFDAPQPPEAALELLEAGGNLAALSPPKPHWNFDRYRSRFERLHSHLHAGDCFQANLTFEMTATYDAGPLSLFNLLRTRQAVAHSALVNLDGPHIISRSPELFFRVGRDGWIESKPMKGTAPRGDSPEEDRRFRHWLETDPKCRSENLMIVDLLRNDLSRICDAGSVHVPELYKIESFATVHQMISRVCGKLSPGTQIIDIMRGLFPCGSITGAPKIRAMEILHELEDTDRNAYCGSIGWIAPGGAMEFNVAIRTISLYPNGDAVFNVGGGIVFDSDTVSEYEESLVKARFAAPPVRLPDIGKIAL